MKKILSLNRNVKLRLMSMLVTTLISYSIFGNIVIYYTQYFGEIVAGSLMSVTAVCGFFVSLYGGHFADEKGRKSNLKIGLTLEVLFFSLAAFLNSPRGIYPVLTAVLFFMIIITSNFNGPAFEATIIDVTTPEDRHFVYSVMYWIQNICVMLGVAVGGWLFQKQLFVLLLIGVVGYIWSWVISIVLMDETRPVLENESVTNFTFLKIFKNYQEALRDKRYAMFILATIFSNAIFIQIEFAFATHLKRDFKTFVLFGIEIYGQRMRSAIVFLNTVIIFSTFFLFAKLTKKWSLFKRYVVGSLLHGIGSMMVMLFDTWLPLLMVTVLFTIGEIIFVSASQGIRANLTNPKKLGIYSSLFATTMPIANFLSGEMVSGSAFFGNWGVAVILLLFTCLRIGLTKKAIGMKSSF